jgi:hypothetical protein
MQGRSDLESLHAILRSPTLHPSSTHSVKGIRVHLDEVVAKMHFREPGLHHISRWPPDQKSALVESQKTASCVKVAAMAAASLLSYAASSLLPNASLGAFPGV